MDAKITGMGQLQRSFGIDIPKQVRYATMQAINDCAIAAQKFEIERQLPSKLTLRSKGSPWWKPGSRFGVNIRPFATRQTMRAVVGSQADWLKLQEQGGTKSGHGHRLAIEAGARPTENAVMPKALKPRQLLRRAGGITVTKTGKTRMNRKNGAGFTINTRSGPAIFIRQGDELKLMYMLNPTARVPAILQFFTSGRDYINTIYQQAFDTRFAQAMASANRS